MNSAAAGRLESYFGRIGDVLGTDGRRASFARYAMGLLGGAERKSVEPIAALACTEAAKTDAEHQRLLHFLGNSPWSDQDVRREAARYALSAMTDREPVEAWIVDDTGFLKQGSHSVGVQRQYTGSAGKITNCQVAVSLSIATRTEHLPIDFELYLPASWTDDVVRRREARIPESVLFKTKPELALDMIRRAARDGIPSWRSAGGCSLRNLARLPRRYTRARPALHRRGRPQDGRRRLRPQGPTARRSCQRPRSGVSSREAGRIPTLHLAQGHQGRPHRALRPPSRGPRIRPVLRDGEAGAGVASDRVA